MDALEYDESAEDANPAGALEEILENPERLKDLDLDAFAEELERQVGDSVEAWHRNHLKCPGEDSGSKSPENQKTCDTVNVETRSSLLPPWAIRGFSRKCSVCLLRSQGSLRLLQPLQGAWGNS